ncbi:MAG TPA: alpha-L-fucosidase [Bryobacteraceae bacterium]|nr:alpha-L-fucosidase [Bryobacteraceae bacterium]
MMRLFLAAFLLAAAACAQSVPPSEANRTAREWFQNARFGMFIHWGAYSVVGDGEWVMNNRKMTVADYEKLAPRFNPAEFHPAQWVELAKAAGMKYITITSKHHDGFAMWGTKQNQWNIVDATPYRKDALKMLADECHRQGMKLFFYHSELDWHNPDYYPRGRTGQTAGRPDHGDWERYLAFMDNQLRELLTGYGEIAGIWFDGWWDKPDANWHLDRTYGLIHGLQPGALIGNNHHRAPFPGEDFQMFEKDLPGQKTAEFNAGSEVSKLPLETCDTINNSWGYNKDDKHFKSTARLIQYLARAAGHNANFLLNIGPMPTGQIQPEFAERLRGIGRWLERNGESIYGTRGGPLPPSSWGATTQRGGRIYVHVLDWDGDLLALSKLPPVKRASVLTSGAPVGITQLEDGIVLHLPKERDEADTVVVLERN